MYIFKIKLIPAQVRGLRLCWKHRTPCWLSPQQTGQNPGLIRLSATCFSLRACTNHKTWETRTKELFADPVWHPTRDHQEKNTERFREEKMEVPGESQARKNKGQGGRPRQDKKGISFWRVKKYCFVNVSFPWSINRSLEYQAREVIMCSPLTPSTSNAPRNAQKVPSQSPQKSSPLPTPAQECLKWWHLK